MHVNSHMLKGYSPEKYDLKYVNYVWNQVVYFFWHNFIVEINLTDLFQPAKKSQIFKNESFNSQVLTNQ